MLASALYLWLGLSCFGASIMSLMKVWFYNPFAFWLGFFHSFVLSAFFGAAQIGRCSFGLALAVAVELTPLKDLTLFIHVVIGDT